MTTEYIGGWAFSGDENEKKASQENRDRLREISHLREGMNMQTDPRYGHTVFSGILPTPEHRELSGKDIALIADHGNLCFGGSCTITGNSFTGRFNVD